MKNLLAGIVLAGFCCLTSQSAWAWGSTGHRAIAEIAYGQLTKKTKAKLAAILDDDYLPLFATYADELRSEENNPLGKVPHYVNMPFEVDYAESVKNPNGDAVTVYADMVATLKNSQSSKAEKAVALKFIIHLVGDMHQPMHVALAEDLGGNKIPASWMKEETNLHRLWDENLINYTRLSYTELARFAGLPDKQEIDQLNKASVEQWIDETHAITKTIYDYPGERAYSYVYYYNFNSTLMQQIQKAGVRLGGVLNELMKDI